MGLFKKRFQKNVSRDNEFLKTYAIKINGLMRYTEDNEKVADELKKIQQDCEYTVASDVGKAEKYEKNIKKLYEELTNLLQQPAWDEQQVLLIIRNIGKEIDDINAERRRA